MLRVGLFLILLLFSFGCSKSKYDEATEKSIDDMRWLKSANPTEDANKAWKKKDFRYLAITGYSLTFPGLPRGKEPNAKIDEEYRIIGYCELMEGEEHYELCILAGKYAESYNKTLLSLQRTKTSNNRVNIDAHFVRTSYTSRYVDTDK